LSQNRSQFDISMDKVVDAMRKVNFTMNRMFLTINCNRVLKCLQVCGIKANHEIILLSGPSSSVLRTKLCSLME
jgi:hypothetical protein